MKIGFIGLGKMGYNLVLNLLDKKYHVVVYNRSPGPVRSISKKGAVGVSSIEDLCFNLDKGKIVFIMVTAGKAVDEIINNLSPFLERGDVVIDGGNSYYEDSIRRYKKLKRKGVHFLDVGVSGGLEGARQGASLMVGGDKKAFKKCERVFRDLAVKDGYGYLGRSGAGHFTKTIHNGIEYSLLESYGEGFEILKKSKYDFNLESVSRIWANGSVIRSWILDLSEEVFKDHSNFKGIKGIIGGGETGRWAYNIARREHVEAKNLENALKKRRESRKKQDFASKFIAVMRKKFGGHKLEKE